MIAYGTRRLGELKKIILHHLQKFPNLLLTFHLTADFPVGEASSRHPAWSLLRYFNWTESLHFALSLNPYSSFLPRYFPIFGLEYYSPARLGFRVYEDVPDTFVFESTVESYRYPIVPASIFQPKEEVFRIGGRPIKVRNQAWSLYIYELSQLLAVHNAQLSNILWGHKHIDSTSLQLELAPILAPALLQVTDYVGVARQLGWFANAEIRTQNPNFYSWYEAHKRISQDDLDCARQSGGWATLPSACPTCHTFFSACECTPRRAISPSPAFTTIEEFVDALQPITLR